MRKWQSIPYSVGVLILLLWAAVSPVLAAPADQSSGGVRFGAFTLQAGESLSEDLVVFGGPVTLEAGSELRGDLTVLGNTRIDSGATLEGELVAMGAVEIAGTVEGDVFSAGAVKLRDTAYLMGNLSALGAITQAEGAVVEGDITPVDEGFSWPAPQIEVPGQPAAGAGGTSFWWRAVSFVFRGAMSVLVMGLLALVVASLWPVHAERVGRVVQEAPLVAFGVGLLTLIVTALLSALLVITICLSPFAVVALIIVGVGILFGWAALGLVLGRRVLSGRGASSPAQPTAEAILGTVILTVIITAARIIGPLHTLLLFLLLPPVAGAVLLTRFGTRPYAATGATGGTHVVPSAPLSVFPPAPVPERAVEAPAQAPSAESLAPLPTAPEADAGSGEGA